MAVAASALFVGCSDPETLADAGTPDVDKPNPAVEPSASTALPGHLSLGAVDCGTTGTTTFELPNRGTAPLVYSFTSSRQVDISPALGTVAPGASQTITVTAHVPATIAARTELTANATMTSNAREGHDLTVPITLRSQGATIVVTPDLLAFGGIPVNIPVVLPFAVRNIGDVAAKVTIAAPAGDLAIEFGAPDEGVTVVPAARLEGLAKYRPSSVGADELPITVNVDGPTCGEPTSSLRLTGQGVIAGSVFVDPGPVDFGDTTCGTTSPELRTTLKNLSTSDATFTADIVASAARDRVFHVSPTSGVVPAGRTVELTVTREPITGPAPPHNYAASLQVVTRLDVETRRSVPIRMNLRAPDLLVAVAGSLDLDHPLSSTGDFGLVALGTTARMPITVFNNGNVAATLTSSIDSPFRVTLPSTVDPNWFVDGTLEYTPVASGPVIGLGGIAIGDACASPLTFELHAGVGPVAVIEPASVTTTAPAPATVSAPLRVTNTGNAPLHIACTENLTVDALQISPAELTIPPGASDAFTVAMAAGPTTSGTVQRDILCTTNQQRRELRGSLITLTVTPPSRR
jgi:hypothetical protein